MKIVLMSDVYLPFHSGVSTAVYILSRELAKLGYDVSLWVPSPKPIVAVRKQFSDGRRIFFVPSTSLHGLYRDLRFPARFYSGLEELDGEETVFHIHSPMMFGTAVVKDIRRIRDSKNAPIAIIASFHTRMDEYLSRRFPKNLSKKLTRLLNFYVKHIFRRVDVTTVPSYFAKKLIESIGVRNTLVLPNPILRFFFKKPKLGLDSILDKVEPYTYFLWLGRISHEKGVDLLATALCGKIENPIIFAGSGPLLNELRKKFGERNCYFLGRVSYEEALTLYKYAISFISASKFETQGLTFLEAMAQGTPPIAYYIGGQRDFIKHGENGFLYKKLSEFKKYLDLLKKDFDLRDELGRNAKLTALKFHPKNLVPKYLNLYRGVLDKIYNF